MLELFPRVMGNEVQVMIVAEIVGHCATTSFNRRKIFEQKEVIAGLTHYIERHLSYTVWRPRFHNP